MGLKTAPRPNQLGGQTGPSHHRGLFDRHRDQRAWATREPISRIFGRREFWSLTFDLEPATFDPRPATETLVEAALEALGTPADGLKVLDLGTGSGCLLLSLLSELPDAEGLGIDIDERSLAVARRNAAALGLGERARFCRGDWGAGLVPGWDVILCNPPYVRSDEIAGLAPEVAEHEPHRALDGGPDGLEPYRRILPQVPKLLTPGGFAVFEVGPGQAKPVTALLDLWGLRLESRYRDLSGLERCLLIRHGA